MPNVPATKSPPPGVPGSQRKVENKSVVILRMQSLTLTGQSIEELEEKYSKKFGCKIIILEHNLELVDVING